MSEYEDLAVQIRRCEICSVNLPLGPRPVFQASPQSRILVVGQAPGTAVHKSGIPFDDPSGDRLRDWLGVDAEQFYDPSQIALIPMSFCYPGKGKGGDLPPRPECAQTWRAQLLAHLQQVQLTIAIGRYAIDWHLPDQRRNPLSKVCKNWQGRWPTMVALPHPSPRNLMWLRKHPWLEQDIVPRLQRRVSQILG